jgi:outer membrane biosynthesis protein TonB
MARPLAWDGNTKVGDTLEAADGIIWIIEKIDEGKKLMFISPHSMTEAAKQRNMKRHMVWNGEAKVGDTMLADDGVTWHVTKVDEVNKAMTIETKWDKLKLKSDKPKKEEKTKEKEPPKEEKKTKKVEESKEEKKDQKEEPKKVANTKVITPKKTVSKKKVSKKGK